MAMIDMNVQGDRDYGPDNYDASPCVYLSEAQCKALGITTPPAAGTTVTLTARAVVQSVTQSMDGDEDDPDVRLSLLLTFVEIGGAPSSSASLYD